MNTIEENCRKCWFKTWRILKWVTSLKCEHTKRRLTALFTKPPDGLPPYRTGSGGHSVRRFPIDIFPFCREWPVTKEPAALWIGLWDAPWNDSMDLYCTKHTEQHLKHCPKSATSSKDPISCGPIFHVSMLGVVASFFWLSCIVVMFYLL